MTREEKAKAWLIREGFNEKGETYVYYGSDSYQIKDSLKKCGFRYNKILFWHSPDPSATPYAEKTFKVYYNTLISIMAWGEGMYYDNATQIIKNKIAEFNPKPASNSKFIQPDEKGKIDVEAVCTGHRTIETAYGISNLFTFQAGDDVITWFTTTDPGIEVGDSGELSGKFKKWDTYNGVDTTYITRAKLINN